MAQVSYGTITITDTNDISRIYVEYCRSTSNQLSGTTVPNITRAWGETTPPWVDGEYIWQRAVVEKSGTLEKTYGTPVCISGEKGETGEQGPQGGTGAAGRSLKSTETQYTTAAANATITQNNMGNYTWSDNVPTYNTNAPAYWVRITNTYENPTKTVYVIYKDNGITDAVKTSADANATASAANTTAGEAKTQAAAADGKADTAIGTANTANTNATNALNIATGINQHFWTIATDYATGIPAGSYITDTAIDTFKSNKTGGNLLTRSDGIWIRNGVNTLTSLTGTALTFYNPTDNKAQLVIGANGTLQSGNYVRGTNLKFSDSGTKIDLTYGDIITKYFRLSQGVESGINAGAYIYGTIEAIDGKIGSNTTNYWEIGNYTDYLLQPSAKLIGHGSSFIQLGNSGTWRLATNRIHTGWYESGDSYLHFPTFTNGTTNRRWDYGIHVPTSKDDKFLYIRNASSATDLSNLISDLEDTQNPKVWEYQFYIDGSGNVHAPGFYIGNSTTPIGGGAGTTAQKIINSDNTYGKGSSTKPIYIDTSGYVQESNSNVGNSTTPIYMSGGTLTALGYTIAKSVPSDAVFTDKNVQSSQANTTKLYLVGKSTNDTSTGTLNFDSNVYLTTTAGILHATKFEGDLTGTAAKATADSDGNKISTTYLKLTGGNVTGAVTFGSSVSADELTVGDLVVNGSASFTNNLQANTINGVAVGSNPKFTDTVTTVSVTGNGNAITSASASNGAVTLTKGTTFPTGSGTNGYLTKWTGANTIGNGPALGSDATKFLNNKGEWAVPAGTGLTSVGASGSGGITISGSPITTSGTIAIGLDLSTAINGLGEGASPATREDYIVAQYAGGGTTTTSYHRRKLSNIFAALNSSDITTALGYTPYNGTTNPNGYITANHTSTYNLPTASSSKLGGVKVGYTTSGKNYKVDIDSNGNLFVNVPWTNVNSSYLTSSSTLNWNNVTQNRPTTAKGYGITDAIVDVSATSASGGSTTFTLTKSDNTTSTFDVVVYASAASQATDANYLTDGTSRYTVGNAKKPIYFDGGIPKASNGTEGTSTKPVYLSSGTITAGSLYAGGTAVTLNGSGKGASTASFYAPTSAGTTNQVLIGGGSAPTWKDISALTPSTATSATKADYLSTYAADGTNNLTALQAIFDSVPKSVGTAIRLQHGSHSMALGWFLDGYAKANAYGGWFISDYGTPTWVGVDNGTWNEQTFITNTNYTNYTVTKTGSGASGTWGISISGNAATANSATNATNASNLLAYSGNEVTIGANNSAAGASTNSDVYINYRDVSGGTTNNNATQLTGYRFCNRKGSTAGITIYAETFSGALSGNADTATKATQDGDGNTITTSYLRRFPWWNYGDTHNIDDLRAGTTFAYGGTHNGPTTGTIVAFDCSDRPTYTLQLMGSYSDNTLFFRNLNGDKNTWNNWQQLVYNSGTWSISISGTATKATQDGDGNTISSTYLKLSGGTMTGPLKWNDASLPQFSGAPDYLVGIDAFASGGTMKWQEVSQITVGAATKATQDGSGNTISTTYVKKSGDTMTGALNTANGIANKIGDDSQIGDFNLAGTLGVQGLNGATGIALLQYGASWATSANYTRIGYDGSTTTISKPLNVSGDITADGGLLKSVKNSNTLTIGSQNSSYTHIYNSANIPFIFSNSVLTTSGDLGNTSYPFTNINITGAYNMLVSGVQKAAMHYDNTLAAIVFSFN